MIILTLFAVNYGLADFGLNTIARHLVGISFKMKGLPGKVKTTVNPVKTLTPRFITRALEKMKK